MKKDEDFSALALGLKSIKRARCAAHSIYCNKRARRRLINIHTRRAESSSHAAPVPPPPRKKITKSGAPSATHKERQRLNLLTAESLWHFTSKQVKWWARGLSFSLGLTPALLLCEGNVSRGAVTAKKKTATFAACWCSPALQVLPVVQLGRDVLHCRPISPQLITLPLRRHDAAELCLQRLAGGSTAKT